MWFLIEHYRHKLPKTFDKIWLQFSSNGNKMGHPTVSSPTTHPAIIASYANRNVRLARLVSSNIDRTVSLSRTAINPATWQLALAHRQTTTGNRNTKQLTYELLVGEHARTRARARAMKTSHARTHARARAMKTANYYVNL